MKFLVVDDNQDLVELIELFIHARMKVDVVKAYDGRKALDLFFFQEPFDLIISDYNMPHLNGGQLYQEIRKGKKNIPFILVSSDSFRDHPEFKLDPYFRQLEKPFVEEDLFGIISQFIDIKSPEKEKEELLSKEFQADEQAFIPVDLDLIRKIAFMREPLYLKISHQKFVKVLHGNNPFSKSEYAKYKSKGIEFLYVDRFEFENFITHYRKTVFFNEFWEKLSAVESMDMLATDLDLVNKASKVFGWSPAVIELAKKNIQNVLALTEKNPNFKNLKEIFQSKKSIRLATHSIILNYIVTSCLKELGWTQNNEIQKLTFAALIHDMYLDEDLFTTKQTLLLQPNIQLFSNSPETEKIILHPQRHPSR